MATAIQLDRKLRRLARGVPVLAGRGIDSVAIGVIGALATTTPVDTRLAASNWTVQRGGPDENIRDPRSATATVNEAISILRSRPTKESEAIFINNPVSYIVELNAGSSQQAPAGFVEAAVDRGIQIARQVRVLTRLG